MYDESYVRDLERQLGYFKSDYYGESECRKRDLDTRIEIVDDNLVLNVYHVHGKRKLFKPMVLVEHINAATWCNRGLGGILVWADKTPNGTYGALYSASIDDSGKRIRTIIRRSATNQAELVFNLELRGDSIINNAEVYQYQTMTALL